MYTCHVITILRDHNVCPTVVRLLYNMYTHSEMQVRWKDNLSIPFALNNGVNRAGCFPQFYLLYISMDSRKDLNPQG